MDEQMIDLSYQQQSVLELLKAHVKSLSEASDSLEDKAQQNFSLSSIIVAIVGSLNLGLGETDQLRQILVTRPAFVLIFVVYAVIVILSILVRLPRVSATHPMLPTWEEAQKWLGYDLEKYYDTLIASYVDIYDKNQSTVRWQGWLVWVSHILIAVDIALIFGEVLGVVG